MATITKSRKYRPKLQSGLRHRILTSLRAAHDAGLALGSIRMPKLTLVASQGQKSTTFSNLGEEAYLATITKSRKYRPKFKSGLRHHTPTSLRAAHDTGLALSAIRMPKLTLVTSQCPKALDFFSPMLRGLFGYHHKIAEI